MILRLCLAVVRFAIVLMCQRISFNTACSLEVQGPLKGTERRHGNGKKARRDRSGDKENMRRS